MLIGFVGAPSCGKSTVAFGLCYTLKQKDYAIEFYAEYARQQIMQVRAQGSTGNGGLSGQRVIYTKDSENALFYRSHTDALIVTDGSTLNCYFYGIDDLDFKAEATKYDLLFYIPMTELPVIVHDENRMQNGAEIIAMGRRWEDTIRPLLSSIPNLVELPGYPQRSIEQMTAQAMDIILAKKSDLKRAA